MKKLFFTALVAIVAVGGAIAQQQYIANPGTPSEQIFTCPSEGAGCAEYVTPRNIYLYSSGTVGAQVTDKTIFNDLELQLL